MSEEELTIAEVNKLKQQCELEVLQRMNALVEATKCGIFNVSVDTNYGTPATIKSISISLKI